MTEMIIALVRGVTDVVANNLYFLTSLATSAASI